MQTKLVRATVLWAVIAFTAMVASAAYTVPANNRVKYNFNIGWKFIKGDVSGAQATTFNDAAWKSISLPYAWNEDEAFKIKGSSITTDIAWYRKHFSLPATMAGRKVFVEFEEIRQAGEVYCNGTLVGRSENGVMASGFDVSSAVKIDGTDNVIAVKTDNSYAYTEKATGQRYQWSTGSYTTNFGGITQNAYLHVADNVYQTLPLFTNLKTTGTYIYGKNYNVSGKTADITAESQVKNESASSQTVTLKTDIVDMDGNLVKSLTGTPQAIAAGATAMVAATGSVTGLNFWNLGYGYLYDVYTMLSVNGVVSDVVKTKTGFRKMEYGNGVAKINDRMLHVKGFAPRSQNPWPAIGDAYPAWMADFTHNLMLGVSANTVRPMHVCALRTDIESADRRGVTYAMPAGDAESEAFNRQWDQRTEVMRDAMIYSRNNPSILWWEAGNADISDAHMQQMIDTAKKFDPNGGRVTGCRGMLTSKVPQYGGEMLYVNKSSTYPRWMMEYSRDESPRRWWDEFSPPEMHVNGEGYSTAAGPQNNRNQDSYIQEEVVRWWEYYTERPGTGSRVNAGGVKIEFCDGTTFNRSDESYRRSGIVDAMRIPKDSYGAFKVMWNGWIEVDNKDVYIVGHWTYPANTTKDIFVVSNCDKVELFVNNVSKGFGKQSNKFLFTFSKIKWESGTIKAVGYTNAGVTKATDQRVTAGAPSKIKLTVHQSPAGLRATGSDFALIDAEVLDADGNRCPTSNNAITYAVTGEGEYRGGMAGNMVGNYILAKTLPVECGMSRISVRASANAGTITVTASATGLAGATATLTSTAVDNTNGLSTVMPGDGLPSSLVPLPPYEVLNPTPKTLKIASASASGGTTGNSYDDNEGSNWQGSWIEYTLSGSESVNQVKLKLVNFKATSYQIKISVGGTQVYSGNTYTSLGYWGATFPAATGNKVRIESTSANFGIIEAELYGPGVTATQPFTGQMVSVAQMSRIQKYPGKIVVFLAGKEYHVNVVDLFGRQIAEKQLGAKTMAKNTTFTTNLLARGVYIVNVVKENRTVQREKFIVQ